MMRSAWLCTALILGVGLDIPHAAAQTAEHAKDANGGVSTETLRLAFGIGMAMVGGTSVETNGRPVSNDSPSLLPMPSTALVRLDYPIHDYMLVGGEASVFMWTEPAGEFFGDDGHYTFDTGGVVRWRFDLGQEIFPQGRNEIVLSLPFGPSFDVSADEPRSYGRADDEMGFHVGFAAGYQFLRTDTPWGAFLEIGFTFHRLPKTYRYELDGGRRATEEVIYRPLSFFLRAGGIVLPFSE